MTTTHYLVIRSDGSVRILTRYPSLRDDEVMYRLRIEMPKGWGTQRGELVIKLPEGLPIAEVVEPAVLSG